MTHDFQEPKNFGTLKTKRQSDKAAKQHPRSTDPYSRTVRKAVLWLLAEHQKIDILNGVSGPCDSYHVFVALF